MTEKIYTLAEKRGLIAKEHKRFNEIYSTDFTPPITIVKTTGEDGPRGNYYDALVYDGSGVLVATYKEQGNYAGGVTSGIGSSPVDMKISPKVLRDFHDQLQDYSYRAKGELSVSADFNRTYSEDCATFSLSFCTADECGPRRGIL